MDESKEVALLTVLIYKLNGGVMKLTVMEENELVFQSNKPDEELKQYFLNKIKRAYELELKNFLEEVSVTLRQMKDGETKTLESRPITVTLEKAADSAPI